MEIMLRIGLSNALVAAALAPLAALLARLSRRPALAHGFWLLVLLKLLTPPLAWVPVGWIERPSPERSALARATPRVMPDDTEVSERPTAPSPGPAAPLLPDAEAFPAGTDRRSMPTADSVSVETDRQSVPSAEASGIPVARAQHVAPRWPSWQTLVATTWLVGSLAWLTVAIVRIGRFARWLRAAKEAPADVREEAERLARRLGLAGAPRVAFVPGGVSPMIWALFGAPRLVVPAELWGRLDAEQRAALLVHELAHVRRRDHWVRAVELVATALYWWHPALWWARRGLHRAEEQCCDAWVVWALPGSGKTYATTLVEAIDFLSSARPALPLGASGMGGFRHLSRRITMIMRGDTPRSLSWAGLLGLLVLAFLLLPWLPTWARPAQKPDLPPGEAKLPPAVDAPTDRAVVDPTVGNVAPTDRTPASGAADEPATAGDDARIRRLKAKGYFDAARIERLKAAGYLPMSALAAPTTDQKPGNQAHAQYVNDALEKARDDVDLIESQLDAKKAAIAEAEARLQQASLRLGSVRKLNEKKVVSAGELEEVMADVTIHKAQLAARQAELREPEVRLRQAKRRLAAVEKQAKEMKEDPALLPPHLPPLGRGEEVAPPGRVAPPVLPPASRRPDQALPDDRRLDELEKKFDRLLREVESLKKERTTDGVQFNGKQGDAAREARNRADHLEECTKVVDKLIEDRATPEVMARSIVQAVFGRPASERDLKDLVPLLSKLSERSERDRRVLTRGVVSNLMFSDEYRAQRTPGR